MITLLKQTESLIPHDMFKPESLDHVTKVYKVLELAQQNLYRFSISSFEDLKEKTLAQIPEKVRPDQESEKKEYQEYCNRINHLKGEVRTITETIFTSAINNFGVENFELQSRIVASDFARDLLYYELRNKIFANVKEMENLNDLNTQKLSDQSDDKDEHKIMSEMVKSNALKHLSNKVVSLGNILQADSSILKCLKSNVNNKMFFEVKELFDVANLNRILKTILSNNINS